MLDFPQGPPFTIFDWLAIREQVRHQLRGLDIEVLSTVYGLSHLEGYEDLEICQEIDENINQEADPVRSRFFFAVALSTYFWEWYILWGWEVVPEGQSPEGTYQTFSKQDGSKEIQQRIKKGNLGWVTEDVSEIKQKAFNWFIEGFQAYSDNEDIVKEVYYMASRIDWGDSLFDRENLIIMQEVTNRDLSFKSNVYAQEIINQLKDVLNQDTADEASGET